MAIVQEVHLTQDKKRIAPVVYAVQNDTGRDLKMVVDDETLVAGMTGKLAFERPDGTYYEASGTLDTATNSFTAEEDQALTKAGTVRCQLKVYDALDDLVSSFFFSISVEPDASGALTEQEGWTVKEAIDTATQAQALAEEAMEDLVELKKTFAPLITETVSDQDIATFDDGADNWPVKDLQVSIEAVQDLHGYDSPWPAGGGKNLIDSKSTITISETAYYHTIVSSSGDISEATLEADVTYTLSMTVSGATTPFKLSVGVGDGTGYSVDIATADNLSNDRVSVTFTPTATQLQTYNVLAIRCPRYASQQTINATITKIQLEKSPSMTEYAPFENICPISGFSQAKVTRTGKNILEPKFYNGISYNANVGSQFTLTENTLVVKTGDVYSISVGSWQGVALVSSLLKPGSYKCNIKYTAPSPRATQYILDKDYKVLEKQNSTSNGTWTSSLILTEERYIAFYIASSTAGDVTFEAPQVELGSTASDFEAYNGQTVTIDLDGTRYGGTIDVTKGKLTVTHGSVDLGTLIWHTSSISGYGNRFYSTYSQAKAPASMDVMPDLLCSEYPTKLPSDFNQPVFGITLHTNGNLQLYDASRSSMTDSQFQTAITGTQLVYELATPVEVDLTPAELETLLGTNNVWADCGNVTVEYGADTKLFIQKLISALA